MTEGSTIRVQMEGDVAHLVLCDPPKNQMGEQFEKDLHDLCEDVLPKLNVAGMIVRGEGRHFSSGADIDRLMEFCRTSPEVDDLRKGLGRCLWQMETIATLPFPVVAAVGGCCLGSGLELALACDFRLATPTSVFSSPEVEFDLMPGAGGTVRLPRLVGTSVAMELLLTGRTVSGEEARQIGLVDALVHRRDLISSADELIHRLGGTKIRPEYRQQ